MPRRCSTSRRSTSTDDRGPRRGAPARSHGHARRQQVQASGQVLYTPWCDVHGKVIDDGTISRLDEHTFRLTSAEPNLRWLSMNAVGLDVAIEDVSERTGALALQGPLSRVILQQLTPARSRRAQVFPARRTPPCATSRSRSRAPATPATSATRSGSTPTRAVDALGRADRGGHAVRHHARPASGRSTSRASRPASSCSTSTTSRRIAR